MTKSLMVFSSVLVLLFLGVGFVSSNPALNAKEIRAGARQVQEAHAAYYQEHLARLQLDRFNCR